MSNSNIEGPLIQINWFKLKRYLGVVLGLVKGIVVGILKIILKLLTVLLIALRKGYLGLRKFAKNKHKGIWILLLVFFFLGISFFLLHYTGGIKKDYQELQLKYEKQLKEYQDLTEQEYELEQKLKEISERVPVVSKLARVSRKQDVENWRYLVEKYFPPEQVENALNIMACESGGNQEAVNRGDIRITGYPSCGLFQINGPTNWEWDNPEENVDRAVTLFYQRGWQPWKNCAIKLGLI